VAFEYYRTTNQYIAILPVSTSLSSGWRFGGVDALSNVDNLSRGKREGMTEGLLD